MRLLDSDAMHMPGRCSELRLRPSAAEDPSGEMAAAIDALCDKIYADINNGVYVSGMSTTQVSALWCSVGHVSVICGALDSPKSVCPGAFKKYANLQQEG